MERLVWVCFVLCVFGYSNCAPVDPGLINIIDALRELGLIPFDGDSDDSFDDSKYSFCVLTLQLIHVIVHFSGFWLLLHNGETNISNSGTS